MGTDYGWAIGPPTLRWISPALRARAGISRGPAPLVALTMFIAGNTKKGTSLCGWTWKRDRSSKFCLRRRCGLAPIWLTAAARASASGAARASTPGAAKGLIAGAAKAFGAERAGKPPVTRVETEG